MTIDRPERRIDRLPRQLRGIGGLWGRYTAGATALAVLFGPWMPVMTIAVLLTLGLPILALYLWGRALDEQLGWVRDEDDGPW